MFIRNYEACSKCITRLIKRRFHINKGQFNQPQLNNQNVDTNKHLNNLIEKYRDKIIYNTYINTYRPTLRLMYRNKQLRKQLHETKQELLKIRTVEPLPVVLKYLSGETTKKPAADLIEESETKLTHFPFGDQSTAPIFKVEKHETRTQYTENVADAADKEITERHEIYRDADYSKWMTDYENYEEVEEEDIEDWRINYGTADPNCVVSNVPCGGCGALLHCKDTAIPGYIPSEIYNNSFRKAGINLKAIVCQRCHFLKHYNLALQVRVSSDDYPKVLETIKNKRALIVLMVDLTDFPCSIWPDIADTLGARRPLVIVGNKVDLLPRDSRGYLERIREILKDSVQKRTGADVKHVSLISAKTGWGVEELITKLHNVWEARGDVYLVGCTNVGKSSLFNCLLQSDYCKVQAVDLVQRATTSLWPGTTLNLLKFPILRPSGWRLHIRTKRLMSANKLKAAEQQLNKIQLQTTKKPEYATLIGHIDRTFMPEPPETNSLDPFAIHARPDSSGKARLGINDKDPIYASSRWCYDTPGVVQPDQIIHLLTAEELALTLPRDLIKPQTFGIRLGQTLFLAGIGRLDYVEGPNSIRLTVFCAETLPITMCYTEDADLLYKEFLGSDVLQVPKGSEERISKWPELKAADPLKLTGCDDKRKSCGDIVMSNAGWIAVTCDGGCIATFIAWTPEAKGIYMRQSLLPYAVALRGQKIRHTPAYGMNKFYVPK